MRLLHFLSLTPPLAALPALALLFPLCSGCSGRRADATPPPGEGRAFDDLGPSDVLVSVDGETLTKQGLEDRVETAARMRKYASPGVSKNALEAYKKRKRREGVDLFVRKTLLYLYAKDAGIRPDDRDRRAFEARFEAMIKGKSKNRSLEKLFETLGEYHAGLLREEIRRDTVVDAAKNRIWAEELRVPEGEIDKVIERTARYNERAAKTNELVFARATNVWNRLKAGEPFEALADSFSEEEQKRPGGYWGDFTLKELPDDAELIRAVKAMKPGAFTPPIEADGGLMIVKLLETGVSGDEPELPVMKPPKTYKLSYIFFRLPLFYEEETREEIRKVLTIGRQAGLYEKLLPSLMKGRDVRYPNGKNLFPPASRAGKKRPASRPGKPAKAKGTGPQEKTKAENAERERK